MQRSYRRISSQVLRVFFLGAILQGCEAPEYVASFRTRMHNEEATRASRRQVLDQIFAPGAPSCNSSPTGSPAQVRRLTREEYQNTVRDLFSLTGEVKDLIPADVPVEGFSNNSSINLVSVDHAVAYSRSAGRIADHILQKTWTNLSSCSLETAGRACAESFLRERLSSIWRRPVQEDMITSLLQIYDGGAEINAREGGKLLLRAILTSPYFLYRMELGNNGTLSAYEWASALSYFFWASTPDASLLAKAADGSLLDDSVLSSEIDRMLQDPKAREGVKAFADNWVGYRQVLQVNKDGNKYPLFTTERRLELLAETEDYFDHMVRERQADYQTLMLADYSFGPESLASYYGVPRAIDAKGRGILQFKDQNRRGLLGQASLLASLSYATETHPIKRGIFVREHILCEDLPPPPPTLNIQPPPPREGASTRERFAAHSSVGACKSCHVRIDGIGFGMEDFDAIGHLRSIDNGRPVDASGQAFDIDGQSISYTGGRQLTEILAQSERAQRCFALQWYRMAHGRLEEESDVCAIRELGDKVRQGLTIRELMKQTILHSSYSQRRF